MRMCILFQEKLKQRAAERTERPRFQQAQQLSSDLILHCGHRVLKDGANLQALNADRFTVAFLPPKHKRIAVQHFQQGRIEFITARTLEKVIRVKRNCFSSTVMNFLL